MTPTPVKLDQVDFYVRFLPHPEHTGVDTRLNQVYGDLLSASDLTCIFRDSTNPLDIVDDVIEQIRLTILDKIIKPNADQTSDSDIVIPPLFRCCPLLCQHDTTRTVNLTPTNLKKYIISYIKANKSKTVDICIRPNSLHIQAPDKLNYLDWTKFNENTSNTTPVVPPTNAN